MGQLKTMLNALYVGLMNDERYSLVTILGLSQAYIMSPLCSTTKPFPSRHFNKTAL